MNLTLRPANESDCGFLYKWRNNPIARINSRNTGDISLKEHNAWFEKSLKTSSRKIYIALERNERVGQVRFDDLGNGEAEISITVDPEKWGKGYGTEIIIKGSKRYFEDSNVKKIIAEIRIENAASKRVFEKAGYQFLGKDGEEFIRGEFVKDDKNYDAVVVLAHELVALNGGYSLSSYTKERTDLGIELFKKKNVKKIILSGGHKDFGEKYGISLAEAMEKHALEEGIDKKNIIKEEASSETAGQLIFIKQGILKPHGWTKIILISHDYHIDRIKEESKFIFGEDYSIEFYSLKSPEINSETRKKREKQSLESFKKTFEGISSGDDISILKRLFTGHPIYNQNQEFFKKGFDNIIKENSNGNGNDFYFGRKRIGDKTLIIAEISANHLGSYERAEKTVRAACEAGADVVKLQTYTPDTITINLEDINDEIKNKYFIINISNPEWDGLTYYELYQKSYTPWEWHISLRKITDEYGVELFSTPFDSTAVDFLEKMNVPAYKISSFDIINIPLLKKIGKTKKPVIMSTGMATFEEIDYAFKTLKKSGCPEIALLHCISIYPAPIEKLNLSRITELKEKFKCVVGFSDHSLTTEAPAMAVLLGARIIEKHITLDRKLGGPDSSFSLNPDEFFELVKEIRKVEKYTPNKNLEELSKIYPNIVHVFGKSNDKSEDKNQSIDVRPSIWVLKNIKKGDQFNMQNIKIARPNFGLEPKHFDCILGKKAKVDIEKGTPLSFKLIE